MYNNFQSSLLILIHAVHFTLSSTTPAPLSVPFTTNFYGTDGLWSAAQIRVGTPEQWLEVFPNTVGSETWVISPAGCGPQYQCQSSRGGVFYSNASSTYSPLGSYDLVGINRLGLATNAADYGLDNISISDTFSASNQIIANLWNPETWLGELGLGVAHDRFTSSIKYLPLISSLVENSSLIPSHSYGYTAGAYYAQKKVPGSLVLGGVDTTRFKPNGVSFQLSSDLVPVVAIQSIVVGNSKSSGSLASPPGWTNNPNTLLQPGSGAQFVIDSSTPFLWMPPAVCDTFASTLNLTYDDNLQLYKYKPLSGSSGNSTNANGNTTSLQALLNWDLTFTFSLANSVDNAAKSIEIPISFNAFNLQLTYGYPDSGLGQGDIGINYFPLRRANSSTQYTLGRAFLQESYLTVDYERNTFSVQPAVPVDTTVTSPNLVAITRPSGSAWPGPGSGGISTGAKVGIAVAVVLVLLAVGTAIYFVMRRKKAQQGVEKSTTKKKWGFFKRKEARYPIYQPEPSELLVDRRQPRELTADSSNTRCELLVDSSNTRFEPIEMPAEDVPSAYLSNKKNPNDAFVETREVALGSRTSTRKDYYVRTTGTQRSHSPAPPYSPGNVGQTVGTNTESEGVSSYDSRDNRGLSSHGSSGVAVSPIGPMSPHSPSDDVISPASPELRDSYNGTMNIHVAQPQSHAPATPAALRSARGRADSCDKGFRENPVDRRQRTQSPVERSSTRSKYSWEQSLN